MYYLLCQQTLHVLLFFLHMIFILSLSTDQLFYLKYGYIYAVIYYLLINVVKCSFYPKKKTNNNNNVYK